MNNKSLSKSPEINLAFLVKQKEGTTIEFKQEMYKLDIGGEGEKRQKGELVKDIISLANGNTSTVGETAYLIIGFDDKFSSEGKRKVYSVESDNFTASRLLDIVNEYVEPKLVDVNVDTLKWEGNNVIVISIPPTPHLYETLKNIQTSNNRTYSEYTVFFRENEKSKVASTREREALRKLKEIYFAETRNPSPIPFGVAIGALAATPIGVRFGEKQFKTSEGKIAGGIAGSIFGGIVGGSLGSIYKDFKEIKAEWHRLPRGLREVAALFSTLVGFLFWLSLRKLGAKKKKIENPE